MRRHSSVSETPSPHSTNTITCHHPTTTNNLRVDRWPEKGYRRAYRARKSAKKGEMAASVLPASNAYNDSRVKYHSVSGGSALSQSMKYAEAWLYGSLSVRMGSSRPALAFFEHDDGRRCAATLAADGSRCSSAGLGEPTAAAGWRHRESQSSANCVRVATVRRQPHTDPYNAVRRSRLAGALPSRRSVRAKSHSPSDRHDTCRRKSILDCDLNAYDLLRRPDGEETAAGYASFSDEEERRVVPAAIDDCTSAAGQGKRTKRRRKLTFGYKSRTKLKEAGEKLSGTLSPPAKKNDEKETTSMVDGVSIAGQKIRIFNAFDRTCLGADDVTDDWITDPSDETFTAAELELVDARVTLANDDDFDETVVANLVDAYPPIDYTSPDQENNCPESTPQRPPRRRCSRGEESDANIAIAIPAIATTARIKSILKKPCATDEPMTWPYRTVVDVSSFGAPPTSEASAEPVAADAASRCDPVSGDHRSGHRRPSLSPICYWPPDDLRKRTTIGGKIKKQVQFKGMRGDMAGRSGGGDSGAGRGAATTTTEEKEDESGSRLTDDADADAKVAAAAETGYAVRIDLPITKTALGSFCDSPSSRLECDVRAECSAALPSALTGCRSPSSVDPRSSPTHPPVSRRIQISAPLQIVTIGPRSSSPPPKAPVTRSAGPQQLTHASATSPVPPCAQLALLVAASSVEATAATPETGLRRHTRHAINSSSLRRLERTLSECVSSRPLLVGLHRKSFTDTMRLQTRADSRAADVRGLFNGHRLPPSPSVEPFRLALPDAGSSLRLTLQGGTLSVPAALTTFECAADSAGPRDSDPRILVTVSDDGSRVPSLTRTFLQNRRRPNHHSPAAKSVVKIDVHSPPSPGSGIASAANAANCTIVTISGNDASPLRGQQRTTTASTRRKNNSVVRVNVAADQPPPPYRANDQPAEAAATATATDSSSSVLCPQEVILRMENQPAGFGRFSASTTTSESSYAATDNDDDHSSLDADFSLHYMSCAISGKLTEQEVGLVRGPRTPAGEPDIEPIYEEIAEVVAASPPPPPPPTPPPPPLPSRPPPDKVDDGGIVIPPRSIFEGASKYDILTYLAGAKERCRIPSSETPRFVVEEADAEAEAEVEAGGSADVDVDEPSSSVAADAALRSPPRSFCSGSEPKDLSRRTSHLSSVSDSSDELACFLAACVAANSCEKQTRKNSVEIERNDSGVGSETSQCSRSKWQQIRANSSQEDQQLVCEDCDQVVESNHCEIGSIFAPLVCRKCSKRRVERREIITEIVETEEKYGRDLRIILDEFYKPMRVAGLLTAEQLSAVFLNAEELLEHNTALAEKLRDGYEIAIEQGDEDLLTFNVGQIFLDATPMLHAFESYCTRQGNAALLLANLEREKELLKIFLRVSQMENTVLRRMNLNSFLMVPVQRVTKYPLLLARLHKVTPEHHVIQRELLREARHHIELHLEHINSVTKDIGSTKIWRKISMINGRRVNGDIDDIISLRLQKIAVEVLEWGHDEVRFAMEGRLFYAQCTDCNWKRSGRTVKVVPINALLVTLGKPTENYNPDLDDLLMFPQKNGIREASLLLMKEKSGKYSLVREPLLLENCIIYCDGDYEEYFEVQEIHSKETYIFKAEDGERTKRWFRHLQYHCQGLGCWRKRRNALANIMMNGMRIRN